ncbi:hypothetical protein KSX_90370 [Ktedonospora formicarum]|uniref:Uncharacterized protein n=1 Tax=Ktedonospora formicarum TaxID=2778364 RepID=A0A8J3IGS4_9CHLR|nr:hypothetical protein KSX_90370 [Ktedonospora formicarum]
MLWCIYGLGSDTATNSGKQCRGSTHKTTNQDDGAGCSDAYTDKSNGDAQSNSNTFTKADCNTFTQANTTAAAAKTDITTCETQAYSAATTTSDRGKREPMGL